MEVEDRDPITVVTLAATDIDTESNVHATGEQLSRLVYAGRRHLDLDLRHMEYLASSAVLSMLILLQKKLQAGGGVLVLRNIQPPVYQIFELTRLNELFDIRKGEDQATR